MGEGTAIQLPGEPALWQGEVRLIDVVLHLGAHGTATGSFQDHLRRNTALLAAQRIGFWGPRRTQAGLFAHVMSTDGRRDVVSQRVQRLLDRGRRVGHDRVVISDANMIGTLTDNIAKAALYPDAGPRMARFAHLFGGAVTTVVICPRSLELYWCSALASAVQAGAAVPERSTLRQIAFGRRGWRDVIADIAEALPDARFKILPFEEYGGAPRALLEQGFGVTCAAATLGTPRNVTPTLPDLRRALHASGQTGAILPLGMGRWNPFLNDEHAALRELYADDMMWLAAGAGGLATQTEDRAQNEARPTSPLRTQAKGRCDELEERRLARPG